MFNTVTFSFAGMYINYDFKYEDTVSMFSIMHVAVTRRNNLNRGGPYWCTTYSQHRFPTERNVTLDILWSDNSGNISVEMERYSFNATDSFTTCGTFLSNLHKVLNFDINHNLCTCGL